MPVEVGYRGKCTVGTAILGIYREYDGAESAERRPHMMSSGREAL
jgi:hypothetical protein